MRTYLVLALASVSIAGCSGGGGHSNRPEAPAVTVSYGIKQVRLSWVAVDGATSYNVSKKPDSASGFQQIGTHVLETSFADNVSVHLTDWNHLRYVVSACNDDGCTDSDPVTAESVPAIGYFKASNAGPHDFAHVAVSGDGLTVAVGAPGESSASKGINGDQTNNGAFQSGAVYVFVKDAGGWSQQAYVKASNTDAGDFFGNALALSEDGHTLVVAATSEASKATGVNDNEADDSVSDAGAVYVFVRDGETWTQQAYVKASNTATSRQFGYELAISGDGNTLAAWASDSSSASGIDGDQEDTGAPASGAVFVFTRTGTTWHQQAYIKASNPEEQDEFGFGLALSADGNTLAVGADREDSSATGIDGDQGDNSAQESGAAYVFKRSDGAWAQDAYIKASNAEAFDLFGQSIALSADGSTLAVGAPYEDGGSAGTGGDPASNGLEDSGAVYLFTRTGAGWAQQAYIKSTNPRPDDLFGYRNLALSNDADLLAVSAYHESSAAVGIGGNQADTSAPQSGAVHLFRRGAAQWSAAAYVKASNTAAGDLLGLGLALSGDGGTLAVGAPAETGCSTGIGNDPLDRGCAYNGAVYLY